MTAGALLYVAAWGLSSLILGVTGAAKAIAAKLGNPGAWECAVAGGLLGLVILVAASYPWSAESGGRDADVMGSPRASTLN
jgi:hypothetical protein